MINNNVEIEVTADGSATVYRADIDEHYHSVKGAVAESLHVYIDCGLRYRYCSAPAPLTVVEIGFGTGLNAALSVDAVGCPVRYVSLELYPLSPDVALKMGYDSFTRYIDDVNRARWDCQVDITPSFCLEKRHVDFLTCDLPSDIDVVYYDAFAPEKQPELWTENCFRRVFDAMRPGGVLTTYCAKGVVRRMLQSAGFEVERLAGPKGGKREILRATKKTPNTNVL